MGTLKHEAAERLRRTAGFSWLTQWPANATWLGLGFMAVYFLAGVATFAPGHTWGDDWAQYLMHARNLLSGRPYPDIGYIYNAEWPFVGQRAYPPTTSAILAPVLAIAGLSLTALKTVNLLIFVAALPLICFVLERMVGRNIAVAGTVPERAPSSIRTRRRP